MQRLTEHFVAPSIGRFAVRVQDAHKIGAYATAGVPEYWIVDVDRDEVLVHRSPSGAVYASVDTFVPGAQITPLVDLPAVDLAALLAR